MQAKHTYSNIKKCTIFLLGILISTGVFAQLTVNTALTPQQLVQNVLVGTGVTVSNITFNGVAASIGEFTTGSTPTNLGLSSGIIMSTGVVNGTPAIGSAASNFASTDNLYVGDPQLQSLVTATVQDASVLEFDFTPLSDTIKFRYVFGSEEYPEFVCSAFNDVFGFFVTGPNPAGGNYTNYNIAQIPGTALPVAINSINPGVAGSDGDPSYCISTAYSMYYVDNTGGTSIVFDGFTTVLTAWCLVVPCLPYHLKIAIGDGGDGSYDSGVFLEANSFSSSAVTMQTNYSNPSVSTTYAVEGCSDAIITFSLPSVTNTAFPIAYSIGGTAINGTDYTLISNNVLIPAGQSSVDLIISPILDGIPEGTETVQLIVQTSICGGSDTVTINILNNDPLTVISSNDTAICGGSAAIWVQANGGIPQYTYSWDNGIGNVPGTTVSPVTNTTYHVTVSDLCGNSATESIIVSVGSSNANAGPDATICFGQNATLTATGGANFLWSNGMTTPSITVSPTITTTYGVSVTGSCGSVDSVTVFVNPLPVITATSNPATIDYGFSSQICASGGATYVWTASPPDPSLTGQTTNPCATVSPLITTTYHVIATDANGCQNTATTTVVVNAIYPEVNFWGEPLDGCVPLAVQFYDNSTKTMPGTIYYWDFGNGTFSYDQNPLGYFSHAGTYSITETVTNPGGLSSSLVITDYVEAYPLPMAMFSTAPQDATTILDPIFMFYDLSLGSPNQWFWNFGDGYSDTQQNTIHNYSVSDYYYNYQYMEDTGSYLVTLIVTTQHGCVDTTSKTIRINPDYAIYVPNAFTPNSDAKNQTFFATGFGILNDNYTMVIYNRWGQKIFYSNDMNEGWDGRLNKTNAPEDIYVYRINFMDTQNIKHEVKGTVTLYR